MKIAPVFDRAWPSYAAAHGTALTTAHHRAARAIQQCRTAALGGHVYACGDCRQQHFAWHSCHHRSCPQCGARDQQAWAAAQEAKLLPVAYFMLTVTVPEELRAFIYKRQTWFYDLFFAAVSEALRDLGHDPRHLGGETGFTAVLHTWTRDMQYHPHLHIILPGVALSADGQRLHRAKGRHYLFPKKILHEIFRNRIKKHLAQRDAEKQTRELATVPPGVWTQPWCINIRAVGSGTAAVRYLARYVFKSALSEGRLPGYTPDGRLRLKCQDSKTGAWRETALTEHEFLRRWSLHVLPRGLVRVRHYGFLSAAAKRKRARLTAILSGTGSIPAPAASAAAATAAPAAKAPAPVPRCPCCGKDMIRRACIPRLSFIPGRPLNRAPPVPATTAP